MLAEPVAHLQAALHILPDQKVRCGIEVVLKLAGSVARGFESILGRDLVDNLPHHLLALRRKRGPECSHKSLEGEMPDRAAGPVRTVREYREFLIRLRPNVSYPEPNLVQNVLTAEREEDIGSIENVIVQDEV